MPPGVTVDYNESDHALPKDELIKRLQGKGGLVCHIISAIDDEVLSVPGLKVVSNVAVGYNNIDVAAAKRRGVVVTNTPDVLTETTADFAFTLLMAAARRVVEADRYVRAGQWKAWKWDLLWGADIHGKTLGVVGFGRIGRAVARRGLGFGMKVLYYDTVRADAAAERELNARPVDMDTLLRKSDFVTLHTLLSADTRHLINERTLRLMKKTAILVNTGRGALVEKEALIDALKQNRIAAAGLDVFHEEPLKPDDPILALPNVVLSPHNAGQTPEVIRDGLLRAVTNVENFLKGSPTDVVVAPLK